MRNSKAKLIRKSVKLFGEGLSEATTYTQAKHKPKKVMLPALNADGTQMFTVVTPVTITLGECQRKLYQEMKQVAL